MPFKRSVFSEVAYFHFRLARDKKSEGAHNMAISLTKRQYIGAHSDIA
jgi:hypothetical protein